LNNPKGPQLPPPICIGGSGEKRTLRTVAKYADHWNFGAGTPAEMAHKIEVLHGHCADLGRDPADILISSHVRLEEDLDYGKVLPLLAWDGHKVVADATLHRRDGSPVRLVGRVKWLIDPEYRGAGLGTALVNDFVDIARADGLRHLTCMLISDSEADAVQTLKNLGFEGYTIPGYGTDPDGNQHDMIKMVMKL